MQGTGEALPPASVMSVVLTGGAVSVVDIVKTAPLGAAPKAGV